MLNEFCDRFLTKEKSFSCSKCNLIIFSKHCYIGHKKLCYGKGHFGWKCTQCNKFFYRYANETSTSIKKNHNCSTPKKCRICFEVKDSEHICSMRKPRYPPVWPLLAFISLEILETKYEQIPFLLIIYRQRKNNLSFEKFIYSDLPEFYCNEETEERFFQYYPNFDFNYDHKVPKLKQNFHENLKRLFSKNPGSSLKILLLQNLMEKPNITFICQDENSIIMVRNDFAFLQYSKKAVDI